MSPRAILLVLLLAPGTGHAARPTRGHGTPSWSRWVTCTPYTATASDILAGRWAPGIAEPASLSQPCELRNRSVFVLLHTMRVVGAPVRACADGDTEFCDTVLLLEDGVAAGPGLKPARLRCVIDREWKRAGRAPSDPEPADRVIEIQGFVHRDPAGGGWELRPVTAFRRTPAAPPN